MAKIHVQESGQAENREVFVDVEMTEEEVRQLAHPNILVEDNRVTVTGTLPLMRVLIPFLLYVTAVLILLETGLAEAAVVPCVLFAVSTLLLAACLSEARVVTVFDGFEKTVHRRNLIRRMAGIPFPDIDRIALVDEAGAAFYEIALKKNRLGKGVRLTRNYGNGDEEFLYLALRALPLVSAMLGYPDRDSDPRAAVENPVFYSRDGDKYILTMWRNQILDLVLLAFAVFAFTWLDGWMKWAMLGMVCFTVFAFFAMTSRVVIDSKEKTISFSGPCGISGATFSLERYAGISFAREHADGIYADTGAFVEFRDPPAKADLGWGVGTRKLSALVDETEAIIAAVAGARTM